MRARRGFSGSRSESEEETQRNSEQVENLPTKHLKIESWGRRGVLKAALRRRISDRIRQAIRARARDRCEDCGRPLLARKRVEYPPRWEEARLRIHDDY